MIHLNKVYRVKPEFYAGRSTECIIVLSESGYYTTAVNVKFYTYYSVRLGRIQQIPMNENDIMEFYDLVE